LKREDGNPATGGIAGHDPGGLAGVSRARLARGLKAMGLEGFSRQRWSR